MAWLIDVHVIVYFFINGELCSVISFASMSLAFDRRDWYLQLGRKNRCLGTWGVLSFNPLDSANIKHLKLGILARWYVQ